MLAASGPIFQELLKRKAESSLSQHKRASINLSSILEGLNES